MALAAKRVGSIHAQIGSRKQIRNQLSWRGGLAELIPSLEDVSPFRAMWAVRACAPEFAVVVAVMAIGAEYLSAHYASGIHAIESQHVGSKAGLREHAAPRMRHGMAWRRGCCELRDQVQGVAGGNCAHREISVCRLRLLAAAGAMAAQAILVLVHRWRQHARTVGPADARNVLLGEPDSRSIRECADDLRTMAAVAVHARSVAIVVEECGFSCVVLVGGIRERMSHFARAILRKDVGVGRHGRNV